MIFSEDRLCSPRRMEKPDWDCVALGLSIISPGGPGGPIGPRCPGGPGAPGGPSGLAGSSSSSQSHFH